MAIINTKAINNTAPPQKGHVTHHQLQLITPHNFNTTKIQHLPNIPTK